MKSLKILLLMILMLSVAIPAFAKPPISDPNPDNLLWPDAFYDYRDQGTWRRAEGGSEGTTGAYFQVSIGVVVGDLLASYDDVISVKAEYQGMVPNTDPEFTLIRDAGCTNWLGTEVQFWSLFLRPATWMFQGEWKFIMDYDGSDGEVHRQTETKEMGDVTFPIKPSHIQVERGVEQFTLSWSGIGNPNSSNVDYRIRIFEGGCVVWELRGDWSSCSGPCSVAGTYDSGKNKVVFNIPIAWDGYYIRLENRIYTPGQTSRAIQYMTLF